MNASGKHCGAGCQFKTLNANGFADDARCVLFDEPLYEGIVEDEVLHIRLAECIKAEEVSK